MILWMRAMAYNRDTTRNYLYLVPTKFGSLKDSKSKDKCIQYLLSLDDKALKEAIYEQDLHSHYLLARHVQYRIKHNKNRFNIVKLKYLSSKLNKAFNNRIKIGGKLKKIKNDSNKYLQSMNKNDKNIFSIIATKTKNLLRDDTLLDIYENHYKHEMSQIQKNILLRKFSGLNDEEQSQFISLLFMQTPDIIHKVIGCQSLHDLEHMLNYAIPQEQQKLQQLKQMIMDYVSNVKFSEPHLKAERYLNSKKDLLKKVIPKIGNVNYEQCQIDPAGDSYVVHLINKDIINSIEDVDENIIMHYAVESNIETNLCSLKEALFPQTKMS